MEKGNNGRAKNSEFETLRGRTIGGP
jgi:hypothetical protein